MIKIMSLLGIAGSVFYFLHILFGRIFYRGYDPLSQAISDLTASDSPSRIIASVFSSLYGIFSVIFSLIFFIYFRGKINFFVTTGAFVFSIMILLSFLGYFFFPLSVKSSGAVHSGTFRDKMHLVITVFVVVLTVAAVILFGIGFLNTGEHKYMGILSLIVLVLLVIGAILISRVPKKYFGVAERINVYSIILYVGVLSLWMYKYP